MRLVIFLLLFFPPLFSQEGLEYIYQKKAISCFPFLGSTSIHIIKVDPTFYEIKPVKALDNGVGRESVLSLTTRYGAIASINGGFFGIGGAYDGQARGTLKIHDWYSLPLKPRGCAGWSVKDQKLMMDRLHIKLFARCEEREIAIDGLNQMRKEGEIVFFTPCFHRTTLTNPDGEEVVVIKGVIEKIIQGGSSKIPDNGYILSIQKTHPLYGTFEVGKPLSFFLKVCPLLNKDQSKAWNEQDYIVGGAPLLLYEGLKVKDYHPEEADLFFLKGRYARTALGVLPDGTWILVVVDKKGLFDGMSVNELRDFMSEQGCLYALNLDGGGSSTMVYEGVVKNNPRGDEDEGRGQKKLRLVSDAILILPKS